MGDTRKLIGFGKNSFVVSVPKSWVERNNLAKGSTISINEKGAEIILASNETDGVKELKESVIECAEEDATSIKTKLISSYINDYNTIILKGIKSAKKAKEIRSMLRDLVAMEIIEQTKDKIVTKDFLNTQDSSLTTIMRRMDIITRSMITDSIACVEDRQYDSVCNRDSDVNRLSHLCFRIIMKGLNDSRMAKKLEMDNIDLLNAWLVTQHIESIADNTKRITRAMDGLKIGKKIEADFKDTYSKLQSHYLDVLKAYYTDDKELAHKVLNRYPPIMGRITKLDNMADHHKPFQLIIENFRTIENSIKKMSIMIINRER